jgi:Highly conserved protein containing a thioredoxin domain
MKKIFFNISICVLLLVFYSCISKVTIDKDFVEKNIAFAAEQQKMQLCEIKKTGKILYPRTIKDGGIYYTPIRDWCVGFFPANLWMTYKLTGDEKWKVQAEKFTESLDTLQYLTTTHDLGFMVGCPYLAGIRFADKEDYKPVIVQAAKSLSTRFKPNAGVIQSWDVDGGWQKERGWKCPVIIDNMMNLELLFEASLISGDSVYYDIAVKHADTTLKNHFREDNSSYHVVDYNPETGEVRSRQTAQGYADESAWSRGQAWGLYGYTVCYRYTKDRKYIDQAVKIADFIFNNKNLPKDMVPYWDYNAPDIPDAPRDASAAAITASALYELSGYIDVNDYIEKADLILQSLSSSNYCAKLGENGNFILMHSVGSLPHGNEIDVPLNYADYYFLEALLRRYYLMQSKIS